MASFQKVKIKEIAQINPDSIDRHFKNNKIKYIDISSVGSGNLSEIEEIDIQNAPSRAKRLVKSGDIILSTVRPNRRSFFYFKNPKENTVVSTGFAALRSLENNDPRYLYYSVTNQLFTKYLTKNAKGSAYPAVDADIIYDGEVFIPKKTEDQTRIASVLSAYDDLIKNNEKRIKILEEMAQLLYTEWFVKFKFTGYEKVKMVESGTEYGMVPEGWEVKRLKEIGKAITGKTPPTGNLDNFDGDVLFIKTPDIHGNIFILDTEQTLSETGSNLQLSKLLPKNTVFISCIGTLGVVGITSKPSQTNQQINAIILNNKTDYILFYFFAKDLKKQLIGLGSNGATMGNVNKGKFENIKILYPAEETKKAFFNATVNIFDKILSLQIRNNNLSKTRDLLIPQLVTGKRELK